MTSMLDRLRRLQALRPQRTGPEPTPPAGPLSPGPPSLTHEGGRHALPAGEVVENAAGQCFVTTLRYPLHTLRGPRPLGEVLAQHPARFADLHPNFGLRADTDYTQAMFLDTETTGLGGGAGVYCFMVGVGTFERFEAGGSQVPSLPSPVSHFVIRQYFMRHPGEEGALLLALAEQMEAYAMSVTFNGRTFDLPLLRARFQQNQHIYPDLRGGGRLLAADRPHLDLLHPARRLWRRRLQSCRLINLEAMILGLSRSEEDVPGSLIPQLYHDFVRTGNGAEMRRVFYHNAEDILSMVALAERLSCAFAGDADAPLEREDWLALAASLEGQGNWADAERAYRRALATLREPTAKADAFARLGRLLKQQARWGEAATLWEEWLGSVPGCDPAPYVELAKYCEWQLRDLEQAAMWAGWALHNLRQVPAWQHPPGALAALEHRLARLARKRAGFDTAGTKPGLAHDNDTT
mgnify:CR=1 FL=1